MNTKYMQKREKEVRVRLTADEHKKAKKIALEMNRSLSGVFVELLRKIELSTG